MRATRATRQNRTTQASPAQLSLPLQTITVEGDVDCAWGQSGCRYARGRRDARPPRPAAAAGNAGGGANSCPVADIIPRDMPPLPVAGSSVVTCWLLRVHR